MTPILRLGLDAKEYLDLLRRKAVAVTQRDKKRGGTYSVAGQKNCQSLRSRRMTCMGLWIAETTVSPTMQDHLDFRANNEREEAPYASACFSRCSSCQARCRSIRVIR